MFSFFPSFFYYLVLVWDDDDDTAEERRDLLFFLSSSCCSCCLHVLIVSFLSFFFSFSFYLSFIYLYYLILSLYIILYIILLTPLFSRIGKPVLVVVFVPIAKHLNRFIVFPTSVPCLWSFTKRGLLKDEGRAYCIHTYIPGPVRNSFKEWQASSKDRENIQQRCTRKPWFICVGAARMAQAGTLEKQIRITW